MGELASHSHEHYLNGDPGWPVRYTLSWGSSAEGAHVAMAYTLNSAQVGFPSRIISNGGDAKHNNVPTYVVVYSFKRTD